MYHFFNIIEMSQIERGINTRYRNRRSIIYAAKRYGLNIDFKKTPWTEKEINEIHNNRIPANRSLIAARNKAFKLGLSFKPFQTRG